MKFYCIVKLLIKYEKNISYKILMYYVLRPIFNLLAYTPSADRPLYHSSVQPHARKMYTSYDMYI